MAASAFGVLLRFLREQRTFSLRELDQLSGIDHAYIYRLETGEKEAPSEDIVSKLIKALKVGAREAEMLRFLAKTADVNPDLVTLATQDPTITYEQFASAAGMRFRGNVRPDPKQLIERIREITKDM